MPKQHILYTTLLSTFTLSIMIHSASAQRYNLPASTDADAKPIVSGNVSGDLLQQVIVMEEEMRRLRGEVEKNNFEINQMKTQMQRMQEDTDFRLKTLELNNEAASGHFSEGEATTQHQNEAFTEEGNKGNFIAVEDDVFRPDKSNLHQGESTAGSGVMSKPGTKFADEPRQHYNQAFRLLNQNNYEEAEHAFATFVKKYPKDPLIGNAYYWLGETYYIRKSYVEAADNFRLGYQQLPEGPKAPDNLLKLAMSLKAQNRDEDACIILDQITKKYQKASTNLLQKTKSEKKLIGCE